MIGHDGGPLGDPAREVLRWTEAANLGALHLAGDLARLVSGDLDALSVKAIVSALLTRSLGGQEPRPERVAARLRSLSAAEERSDGQPGESPAWTREPGADDRALLIVLVAALRDAVVESGEARP